MQQSIIYVGLDVHKDTIAVALAEAGERGLRADVREHGKIANTPAALKALSVKLAGKNRTLRFCYEAGPCGYGIQRQLSSVGHECAVVAPSLIPRKPGERIKTDRRDAINLAKLHRAGELTPVWVPDPAHEAIRDLVRARQQSRESVTQALDRIRQAARSGKGEKFTSLFHHISPEMLMTAYYALSRKAAAGVDGLTWAEYEQGLEARLRDLHERVQQGRYAPQPSRRTYIPKADGRQRPLAVAALEDKIVQGALVMVLNAVYEEHFLGFSYGFRPGRGPHDALDALAAGIDVRKVNFIVDADIRSFFDSVSQDWLVRFVEHCIGDRRIVRLIRKWLRAGILEDGTVTVSETGTGQGSVISPLLANIYLHYVLDLWAQRWRRREATGDMIIVRYADDVVVGFERASDASRFLDAMRARLEEFSLSLHPDKTRLIEFGRYAAERRRKKSLGKPETFNFLGFTHICGKTRKGFFQLRRKCRSDRMRAKLSEVKEELRKRRHEPIPETGQWLGQVLNGFYNYFAVPTNFEALRIFRQRVEELWRRTLKRRSQKDLSTFERIKKLAKDYLPEPRILHPWPDARFAVKH